MRCVKDRRVDRWQIIVPFHKEFCVSPTIAGDKHLAPALFIPTLGRIVFP
jgi:hypothetical protein